ncbi:uncharacterized protein LOC128983113 isoform X3 [Macrosteles quadrilineatus]|uniref:uncharacterized protein LOC128983113 isoform X3 n=1 Tax=Macrosteles quadrilineatus TaxID=74068 RepID=UPI0023E159D8|nr:uncharacterized protein LOC128983113 isoform X3 [Macrosteles quadrilineatus]
MQPGMEDTVIENIDGVPVIRIRKELWKNPRTPVREKRPIWTSDEVIRMIQIIKDKNILSLLYGGKYRRNDVFKVVAANLRRMGYNRTAEQISTKWKHLRLTYAHAKAELKSGISTAGQECAFYEQMDDLLGDRLHIVGIDAPAEADESKHEVKVEIHSHENMEQVIEDEVQLEFSETDYSQVDFSQVEVIETDASVNDVNLSETIGHEEMVQEYMIEVQEPQSDLSQMEFTQDMESETAEETSPPKNIKKRRMFSNPPGRFRKSNEGTYSNALKNFTKEWELMMIRVAEKEREQDRLEKEKEKMEQRRWEERLIEAQSEAMTKANSEFLSGLKGLFDELKN